MMFLLGMLIGAVLGALVLDRLKPPTRRERTLRRALEEICAERPSGWHEIDWQWMKARALRGLREGRE